MNSVEHRLVIVRHGSSEWNLSGRFTGWTNIQLNEQGLAQDAVAGQRLAAEGWVFDEVHTSVLQRAQQSADSLLKAACNISIPHYSSWRLNERHYGQLQGLSKQEIFEKWGEQRYRRWWRGYYDAPPPLELDDQRHPRFDPLYTDLDPALLSCSESLSDCLCRLLPYWDKVLAPRIAAKRNLLVVSHDNTIRSLVMYLEKIVPEAIEKVEITPSMPLVYRCNEAMEVVGREWLK